LRRGGDRHPAVLQRHLLPLELHGVGALRERAVTRTLVTERTPAAAVLAAAGAFHGVSRSRRRSSPWHARSAASAPGSRMRLRISYGSARRSYSSSMSVSSV